MWRLLYYIVLLRLNSVKNFDFTVTHPSIFVGTSFNVSNKHGPTWWMLKAVIEISLKFSINEYVYVSFVKCLLNSAGRVTIKILFLIESSNSTYNTMMLKWVLIVFTILNLIFLIIYGHTIMQMCLLEKKNHSKLICRDSK